MGLIKAALGAANGTLGDQWKEYFYCDSLNDDTLVAKGQKKTSSHFGRSSNSRGEDDVISNGSLIAVNEGQAMMIVEQGAIVEFSAEPGEFTYDSSSEPSIFTGDLKEGVKAAFEPLGWGRHLLRGDRAGGGGDGRATVAVEQIAPGLNPSGA